MRDIIRLLTDNPILLILLVTWVLSALGGVFTRAARKAEQERRRAAQEQRRREQGTPTPAPPATRPTPTSRETMSREAPETEGRRQARRPERRMVEWPAHESRWPEQPGAGSGGGRARSPSPARQASGERPRAMTPEEAAAEIRRMMGMEPEAAAARREPPQPEPRSEPVPEGARGRSLSDFRSVGTRPLQIHVDPHVGEAVHDRRLARRRSRLAPERLVRAPERAPGRRPYELSELRNLPKAFVLREVLGPPKALQDVWAW